MAFSMRILIRNADPGWKDRLSRYGNDGGRLTEHDRQLIAEAIEGCHEQHRQDP